MSCGAALRVLIVQRSSNLDGSAFSALLLADGFREAGWETHIAFGFEGPMQDVFKGQGHKVHVLPHNNWLRRAHLLRFVRDVVREGRSARRIGRVLRALQPDLVYVNTAVSLAGVVATRVHHIPCIWHLRELFSDVHGEMRAPGLLRPLIRMIFRRLADQLVVTSGAVAQNMLGEKGAQEACVIPNAVGTPFFENTLSKHAARSLLGLPEDGVIIGVPGTLRPMKGHPFIFQAVPGLLRHHSGLILAVTGEGKSAYRSSLTAQVQQAGIDQSIRFLGTVTNMPAFYRACDVVCIPSVAEPFGRTVIVAFASGTPVVATAVGGMQETVEDGVNGILVAYGQVPQLVAALQCVLCDEALREHLRRHALEAAHAHYHESTYKQRLVQLSKEVVCDGHHMS